jgi:hypothetical protein
LTPTADERTFKACSVPEAVVMVRVFVAGVALLGGACVSVRPVVAPEQFIPAEQPALVWVTTTEDEVIPVAGPTVRDAAIMGTWRGLGEPVAIPLSRARLVQARQPDRRRTTLLLVGLGAGAGFLVWRALSDNASDGLVCYGYGQQPGCL